jgi:hypothetical protein
MFVTDQQAAEQTKPGIGSFSDPAAPVTSQLSSAFVPPFIVLQVWPNQLDATLPEPFSQRGGVQCSDRQSHASAFAMGSLRFVAGGLWPAWLVKVFRWESESAMPPRSQNPENAFETGSVNRPRRPAPGSELKNSTEHQQTHYPSTNCGPNSVATLGSQTGTLQAIFSYHFVLS